MGARAGGSGVYSLPSMVAAGEIIDSFVVLFTPLCNQSMALETSQSNSR